MSLRGQAHIKLPKWIWNLRNALSNIMLCLSDFSALCVEIAEFGVLTTIPTKTRGFFTDFEKSPLKNLVKLLKNYIKWAQWFTVSTSERKLLHTIFIISVRVRDLVASCSCSSRNSIIHQDIFLEHFSIWFLFCRYCCDINKLIFYVKKNHKLKINIKWNFSWKCLFCSHFARIIWLHAFSHVFFGCLSSLNSVKKCCIRICLSLYIPHITEFIHISHSCSIWLAVGFLFFAFRTVFGYFLID